MKSKKIININSPGMQSLIYILSKRSYINNTERCVICSSKIKHILSIKKKYCLHCSRELRGKPFYKKIEYALTAKGLDSDGLYVNLLSGEIIIESLEA